jgi:hypothetical protein
MRLPKFIRRLWMPLFAVLILGLIATIQIREPFQGLDPSTWNTGSTKTMLPESTVAASAAARQSSREARLAEARRRRQEESTRAYNEKIAVAAS